MRLLPALLVLTVGSCASNAPRTTGDALVVTDGDRTLHSGPAAWTVRATSTGREDVVAIPGVGELVVGSDSCKLVRPLPDAAIAVWTTSGPCVAPRDDRLCFAAGTRFRGDDGGVVDVVGCADKNELFLDRLAGGGAASVGPTSFVERCTPVPAPSPTYLRVRAIFVEQNDRPEHGLRLRYSDGFEVCFLSRLEGRYRIELDVEDPTLRRVSLAGAVEEL